MQKPDKRKAADKTRESDDLSGVLATEQRLVPGDVEVTRIGDVVSGPQTVISREPLCGVLYLYQLEGAARLTLSDVGVRTLGVHDVLVVFPGRVVTVELTAPSNRLMLMVLQGPGAVDASLRLGFWDLMQIAERYESNFMQAIVGRFRSAPKRGSDPHVLDLVERLLETVWLRARNGSGQGEVFNAVRHVNRLPSDGLTTDAAADALGVSRTKLNTLFLSGLGMRPGEYLSQIVLARSLALLYWTTLSVAQVATRMGFSSASAFSVFLRRRTGMTPAAFRQKPIEVAEA